MTYTLATWGDEVVKIITAIGGTAGLLALGVGLIAAWWANKAKNQAVEAKVTATDAKDTVKNVATAQGQSLNELASRSNLQDKHIEDVARSVPGATSESIPPTPAPLAPQCTLPAGEHPT